VSQDYTYIVARLNAIEATMPDRAWFLRMARIPEQQLPGMIREHYGAFESVEKLFEFERALEQEKAELLDLLTSLIQDKAVVAFLRAGYDFDNFTQALKGRLTGGTAVLLPFGTVDTEKISTAVESGRTGELPGYLKDLSERVTGPAEAGEIEEVEYRSAGMKYRFLLGAAPTDGAREWVRLKIDRINIGNFMRFRMTALRRKIPAEIWIEGGNIERSRFVGFYKEPVDEFLSFMGTTAWRGVLGEGFAAGMEPGMIDTVLDRRLLEITGEARYRFFDLLPVLHHLDLRDSREKLLRMIIVMRINRLPEDMTSRKVEAVVS
jgi:V/A-type H+-transporting ATPase subunit C